MNVFVYGFCVSASLFVSCLAVGDVPGSYVQIYSQGKFKGYTEMVNLTSGCNSVAHFLRSHGTIGAINTRGFCVNVYENENCLGNFISLKPGNPFHELLKIWDDIDRRAKAIGLCHDICHETKIETEETARVEIFGREEFQGTNQTIRVQQGTCSSLSQEMQGVIMSLKVDPKACIELHQFSNCGGNYRDFPVGSPGHNNLRHWGEWDKAVTVESVSFCGYRCHQTHIETETTFSSTTTIDEITSTVSITEASTLSKIKSEHISMKEESKIIESNLNSSIGDSTSGNYIWILLIVSLCIVTIILLIVGVNQFIKHRYGRSGYRVMFQNIN